MNKIIFDAEDMSSDVTGDWITIARRPGAASQGVLMVAWNGVTGTLDGTIDVQITNDSDQATPVYYKTILIETGDTNTYDVDVASNLTAAKDLTIASYFTRMRLVYTANNVTAGSLYATYTIDEGDGDE